MRGQRECCAAIPVVNQLLVSLSRARVRVESGRMVARLSRVPLNGSSPAVTARLAMAMSSCGYIRQDTAPRTRAADNAPIDASRLEARDTRRRRSGLQVPVYSSARTFPVRPRKWPASWVRSARSLMSSENEPTLLGCVLGLLGGIGVIYALAYLKIFALDWPMYRLVQRFPAPPAGLDGARLGAGIAAADVRGNGTAASSRHRVGRHHSRHGVLFMACPRWWVRCRRSSSAAACSSGTRTLREP